MSKAWGMGEHAANVGENCHLLSLVTETQWGPSPLPAFLSQKQLGHWKSGPEDGTHVSFIQVLLLFPSTT